MPVHVKIVAAAKNVLAEEAARVGVLDRLLHDVGQITVLAANVDVTRVRTHSDPRNYDTFDYSMRVMLEDQPIFAGARFALVTIA